MEEALEAEVADSQGRGYYQRGSEPGRGDRSGTRTARLRAAEGVVEHPSLINRGGQGPIIHLEASVRGVVAWAAAAKRRWAFSLSNAGSLYAEFRADLVDLDQVDWAAVSATDFRSRTIKEGKQAEFLVHESVPWGQVVRIGVQSREIRARVENALEASAHRPRVEIQPSWYY